MNQRMPGVNAVGEESDAATESVSEKSSQFASSSALELVNNASE